MLVQLSPWKSAPTSIRCSQSQKRRKRDGKDFTEFPITASFVTTSSRRGQQKMKKQSLEFIDRTPVMTITSDHRITVIGCSKEPSYQEYNALQYSSRPGKAGSFLPPKPDAPNGTSSTQTTRIAAIFDSKSDRVYAFQNENTRLCCWNSLSTNGPNDKQSLKVQLSSPALSMSFLPWNKGLVYGTCKDGNIYIAAVSGEAGDGEKLSVEYVHAKKGVSGTHFGTVAELPRGSSKNVGRKRKMSDADGNVPVIFYQAFHEQGRMNMVRHSVDIDRTSLSGTMVIESSLSQDVASIDLVSESSAVKGKLSSMKLLVSSSSTTPKVAIMYKIDESLFCAAISKSSGEISHKPILLPGRTRQCGLVTESLMVAATQETVTLFDLETGSNLHSTKISDMLESPTDEWLLCTDAKLSSIGIIYEKDEKIHASFSVASLENSSSTLPSAKLTLSSKLSSSLISASKRKGTEQMNRSLVVTNNIMELGNRRNKATSTRLESVVEKALSMLTKTCDNVKSPSKNSGKVDSFIATYERCNSMVLDTIKSSQGESEDRGPLHNPQDALPLGGSSTPPANKKKRKDKQNGIQKSPKGDDSADITSSIPQSFLDGSLKVALSVLHAPLKSGNSALEAAKLDARTIVSRVLKTGRISGRMHFEGIDGIQESSKDHFLIATLKALDASNSQASNAFCAIDFILEALDNCPDLSERQLVVILDYILRRSNSNDIARIFVGSDSIPAGHPYKKLSKRFLEASSKSEKSNQEEQTVLSSRLVVAGAAFVLQRIVQYSECNEAMLRVSLLEEIKAPGEAIILAKLLSDMLTFVPKEIRLMYTPTQRSITTTCQWVAALCDSFKHDLSETQGDEGESYMTILLQSVNSATQHSQAILSLREDMSRVRVQKDVSVEKDNMAQVGRISMSGIEEIPGYSIDRIIF